MRPPSFKDLQWASRTMATASANATPKAYPFSKTALVLPEPFVAPAPSIAKGRGLMAYINKHLPKPEKQVLLREMFGKHSSKKLVPGSIVSVTTEYSPGIFTGVLLAIRRRGPDTSFVVRNVIQRSGVEMKVFPNSPLVKEIKVLQKPPGGRMRRAKLFYLRDSPEKMTALAGNKRK